MANGTIVIDTRVNSAGFKKGIADIKRTAKAGLGVTKKIFAASATAVAALGAYSMKVGTQFESSMSEVEAISGATGDAMESLTEKAKEMGAKTKFSASESAAAFKYMAMAGWKTEDMLSGIEGVMNLAAASGEDLATTSDIVTDALTAFGLTAKDSGHFADILAAASSNANTNVGMMGETFKYVAPVAGALGFSASDTATAIGLMANAGIKSSQAGTTLRAILSRMAKPTNEVKTAMDSLGISITKSDGSMKSLKSIMAGLRKGFSGLSKTEKAEMAAAIGGQEAMSGLLAIVNAGQGDFDKLSDAIENCDGATEKMAETMNDTVTGQMTIMKSAMEGIGITVYEHFQEPIKDAFTEAAENFSILNNRLNRSDMQNSLDKIGQAIGTLIERASELATTAIPKVISVLEWIADHGSGVSAAITGIASAMITFKAATGVLTVVTAFQKMATAINAAQTATAMLNATMLLNPFALAAAAVVGLGAGIWKLAKNEERAAIASDKLLSSSDDLARRLEDECANLEDAVNASIEHKNAISDEYGYVQSLSDELYELAGKTSATRIEKARMAEIVDILNGKIDGLNLKYDAEKNKLNKTKSVVDGLIESKKRLAVLEAAQADYDAVAQKIYQAEKTKNEAINKRIKLQERLKALESEIAEREAQRLHPTVEQIETGERLTERIETLGNRIKDTKKEIAGANRELNNISGYIATTNAAIELDAAYKAACDHAKENGAAYSSEVRKAFKDAKDAALEAGIDIPAKLTEGLTNGSTSLPQATAILNERLTNLMNLNSAAEKAGIEADKIPKKIAERVISGEISVQDAFLQLEEKARAGSEGVVLAASVPMNLSAGKASSAGKTTGKNYSAGIFGTKGNAKAAGTAVSNAAGSGMKSGGQASSAGKSAGKKYASGISGTKGNAKAAGTGVSNAAGSGMKSGGQASSAGTTAGKKYASGVSGAKGSAKAAGTAVSNAAKNGAKSNAKSFVTVGLNIAHGVVNGILTGKSAVISAAAHLASAALSAAKNALGIESPSRTFRDEVGKNIALGIVRGVEDYSGTVETSISKLMERMVAAAKNIGKKNISDVGDEFADKLSESISNKTDKAVDSITKTLEKETERISKKYEAENEKLKKEQAKNAKSLIEANNAEIRNIEKASKTAISQITKSLNREADKLIEATAEKLRKVTEEYDKRLTELREKRTAMKESLSSLGSLFKTSQVTIDGDDGQISYDVYSLESLKDKIAIQERYRANMEALKEKVPGSLMDAITSLGIEDAIRYTDMLLSSNEESFAAYIADWKTYRENAQSIARDFYSSDIESVKEGYAAECEEIQSQAETMMKGISDKASTLKSGLNKIGADAMKGFEKGMLSRKGSLAKAVAEICSTVISTARKTLDSHSPSRVFADIGRDTVSGAEIGAKQEAPRLYAVSDEIAESFAQRFAAAKMNVSDIVGRMRSAVFQERRAVAAAIAGNSGVELKAPPQMFYEAIESPAPVQLQTTAILELDGREVSRTIVPYMDADLARESERRKRGG